MPAVSGVVPGRSAVRAGVVAWVLLTGCVVVLAPLSWWDLTVGSTPVAGRAVIGDGPGGGPAIREVLVTSSPLFAWRWLWTLADGARVVRGRGRFGSSDPSVVKATIVAQAVVAALSADGVSAAALTGGS